MKRCPLKRTKGRFGLINWPRMTQAFEYNIVFAQITYAFDTPQLATHFVIIYFWLNIEIQWKPIDLSF